MQKYILSWIFNTYIALHATHISTFRHLRALNAATVLHPTWRIKTMWCLIKRQADIVSWWGGGLLLGFTKSIFGTGLTDRSLTYIIFHEIFSQFSQHRDDQVEHSCTRTWKTHQQIVSPFSHGTPWFSKIRRLKENDWWIWNAKFNLIEYFKNFNHKI